MYFKSCLLLAYLFFLFNTYAQKAKKKPLIIAYYTGDSSVIQKYNIAQIDEIIYCFAHVQNDSLAIRHHKDTVTLNYLVGLKKQYPKLKIVLSMGGWSGCAPCSETFSRQNGRTTFATTTKQLLDYFGLEGLDLDWEYPTIAGFPGHLYQASDKTNFTELIRTLRKTLGKKYELSFAAGGFQSYLDSSVEWQKIMPLIDHVNIMSYDLVNGYSTVTGHHTPLYSTNSKEESADRAVQYLLRLGIPSRKLVIGGAFYTRTWKSVLPKGNGIYQKGEHAQGADAKKYDSAYTIVNGWETFWDKKAKATYWYNKKDSSFATGDDLRSIKAKTQYVVHKKLGGIMFWELVMDKNTDGMVQTMHDVIYADNPKK